MIVVAEHVSAEAFAPFGWYYPMTDGPDVVGDAAIVWSEGIGWQDARTDLPLIDLPGSLGVTRGGKAPYLSTHMERHLNTQEALFCMREPVILAVALSSDGDQPRAQDVRAFIIRPGDVVVLERAVWHDACRGLGAEATYYWFAACNDGGPVEWVEIADGPVDVTFSEGR
jgi:ureidoglycolate lyase